MKSFSPLYFGMIPLCVLISEIGWVIVVFVISNFEMYEVGKHKK